MAKRPDLVVLDGELAGKRFEIKKGGARLGRSSSNDIQIPDEELSRNHCFFECVGENDVRLTDLASANGTIVNNQPMGGDPVILREGDVIQVGNTTLRFGESTAAPIDLGLGANKPEETKKPRSPIMKVLWTIVVLVMLGAAAVIFKDRLMPADAPRPIAEEESPALVEFSYERVKADSQNIYRYYLTLSADRVLQVKIDDVPTNERHVTKQVKLTDEAWAEICNILNFNVVRGIDREYVGTDTEPPTLDSRTLKIVYASRARSIHIANTDEPEAFRAVREQLEAFSKNELGVWAIQYPREKLMELAEETLRLGRTKWEDRDVKYENLAQSIEAYREVTFYLETINPKPAIYQEALDELRRSTDELNTRFAERRFLANRALNLSQWENAAKELRILMEMIPDAKDERHKEAKAKLISAEARIKKGGEQ